MFRWVIACLSIVMLTVLAVKVTADEQRTNRVIENPVQDGNLVLRINDGGVKTDAITVTGSTSIVSFANPLASGSVDSTSIVDGTIANIDISAGANISGTKIATDSITSSQIGVDAVGASELADNSVASANVVDNTLVAADIAADAIGASELADNSVASANIIADTIVAADIATGAVGTAEILDGTITNTDINSISTSVISDVTSGYAGDPAQTASGGTCNVQHVSYIRVGSIVTAGFTVSMDGTAGANMSCAFAPPIASNFGSGSDARGTCIIYNGGTNNDYGASVVADPTAHEIVIGIYNAASSSPFTYTCTVVYRVI